jgi:hypothetical protein
MAPRIDIAVDRSFCILYFLHPRGIPYVYPGQAPPIQSSHSHYYLLLGHSMPLYGIRTVIRLSCGVPHTVGVFRRLPFSCHDLVPLQLVQARGTGSSRSVPLQ